MLPWNKFNTYIITISIFFISLNANELILRNNLQKGQPGDYIVIAANKTDTVLVIQDKKNSLLTIQEIAVPESKRPSKIDWKQWIDQGGKGNISWVRYDIDLKTGKMSHYFSFTKNQWFEIPERDNFLSKLLNLKFSLIPEQARKRMGLRPRAGEEKRPLWQPQMIIDGQVIKGVPFDAWKTQWPNDGSELSGKVIEVYLPNDDQKYPAYFPYWLQISGVIGKANVRMIDSGHHMIPRKSD